jgi:predicted nucleic acid-binding protein
VTVGYIDSSALALIMLPGEAGAKGAAIWDAVDTACTHQLSEIEVPAQIGREMNRFGWIWAVNLLSIVSMNEEIQKAAIDLAWIGAPASVAVHIASAEALGADHFVTGNEMAESWALIRGLNTVRI